MPRALLRVLTLVFAPVAIAHGGQSSRASFDLAAVLEGVGQAVERYFARAQSLILTETVTLQAIGQDYSAGVSSARRLTYELRVAWQPSADGGAPEATMERRLLKVGGREPRPKDKPGCTDPREVTPEPLSFLLPLRQKESVFTLAGSAKVDGRAAVTVDYRAREVGPITSTSAGEDCFSIDLPGRQRGRVWIDVVTNDVLRVDERLTGMFDVSLASSKNERDRQVVTIERLDSSTVYRAVTFTDPDETVMLPKSVDTVQIVRNSGSPRLRKTQVYSNYRRFITGGRIVQDD